MADDNAAAGNNQRHYMYNPNIRYPPPLPQYYPNYLYVLDPLYQFPPPPRQETGPPPLDPIRMPEPGPIQPRGGLPQLLQLFPQHPVPPPLVHQQQMPPPPLNPDYLCIAPPCPQPPPPDPLRFPEPGPIQPRGGLPQLLQLFPHHPPVQQQEQPVQQQLIDLTGDEHEGHS